jgi:hypothetical protein
VKFIAIILVLFSTLSAFAWQRSLDTSFLDKTVTSAMTCINQLEPHDDYSYPYTPAEFKVRHPSLFGCFDWHASVFNHAALVRILNKFPVYPRADEIKALLAAHFTKENIAIETQNMEADILVKMYEPAWLMQLMVELRTAKFPEAAQWAENLVPMEQIAIRIFSDELTKIRYADTDMMHSNTSFALARAWDYAVFMNDTDLLNLMRNRAMEFYSTDTNCDAAHEVDSQYDIVGFISPCFAEADLMHRVLSSSEFQKWFKGFFPAMPPEFLTPVQPAGKYPYYQAGLMLSKAMAMRAIAHATMDSDVARKMASAANVQRQTAEGVLYTYGYMGEHWLPPFYIYSLE